MTDQIILIIVGLIMLVVGIFRLYQYTRRGQRMVNWIGDTPSRLIYILIGIIALIMSYFVGTIS